jgi:hypothetical protein
MEVWSRVRYSVRLSDSLLSENSENIFILYTMHFYNIFVINQRMHYLEKFISFLM